tara:strand:- start:4662 stop:6242 length:1581 start_codon:yes stop_codon:yes gene_type:complete
MQVESICIVGGGSSGWMTAALLSKEHPDIEMVLIESPNIKPIGVGESTLAWFNRYLKRLDLKDRDWMKQCNATYKASIAFKNFREGKGEQFQYPFGAFGPPSEHIATHIQKFFELQCVYGKEKYPPEEFARFVNKLTYVADAGKMTMEIPGSNQYLPDDDLSYHLNADKFGEYLRDNIAVPNGCHHVLGDVNNVIKTPDGTISAITTTDGQCISADMFIDCSGFKSLLLEQHMGVEFVPFKDMLFNDSAIVTHIDYTDKETQMDCYTKCVALKYGWVYNIPMWNNIGTGYVYSSKYINECEAELEFREYLNDQECPLMPIKIKHGKHKKGWVKNVIGIGLSYGFLEPLESTGLLTTHENLLTFSDILATRDRHVTHHDRSLYNYSAEKLIESMKNFVTLHYTLSLREDTQYWRDATDTVEFLGVPGESTEATLHALQDYRALLDYIDKKAFDPNTIGEGTIYVSTGMGIRPFTETIFNDLADDERRKDVSEYHDGYCKSNKSMLEWVNTLPSHYQYLKDTIYVESV